MPTRSPSLTWPTSAPTANTWPTPSWPGMNGRRGFTGQSPSAACKSVWQTPQASILTSTSWAPGRGTSTSSITSGLLNPCTTAAFIVLSIYASWGLDRNCEHKVLVIVTWCAVAFHHVLIFHRHLENGAGSELTNMLPVYFLPGRLIDQLGRLDGPPALRKFGVGDEDVGATTLQVDADAVARAHQGQTPADGGFRRCIEDRGAARGPALSSIANTGQLGYAAPHQGVGRKHVDNLSGAGITDGADKAHDEQTILVDPKRRVVDAAMIILRAIEHDGPA